MGTPYPRTVTAGSGNGRRWYDRALSAYEAQDLELAAAVLDDGWRGLAAGLERAGGVKDPDCLAWWQDVEARYVAAGSLS